MIIKIRARKWFQKTYGNTYHSCKVFVDNNLIGHCPFTYGYGDQYMQTAHKLLQEAGYYPKTGNHLYSGADKDYYEFQMDIRNNRDKFDIEAIDVFRKKDL